MTEVTCETQGHLWGSAGVCVMCKAPKPPTANDLRSLILSYEALGEKAVFGAEVVACLRELHQLRDRPSPEPRVALLEDILQNIAECISGHDGIVFDDIQAHIDRSRKSHETFGGPAAISTNPNAAPAIETEPSRCAYFKESGDHHWIEVPREYRVCSFCHAEKFPTETSDVRLPADHGGGLPRPPKQFHAVPAEICRHCGKTLGDHIAIDHNGFTNVCTPTNTLVDLG